MCRTCAALLQDDAYADRLQVPDAPSTEFEVADTLKVAALVQQFRSRGHLVAQLDPLRRVQFGPWCGDVAVYSPWLGLPACQLFYVAAKASRRKDVISVCTEHLSYYVQV